jgi:phytoene synthase
LSVVSPEPLPLVSADRDRAVNDLSASALEEAYAICREISKREAKNFYYSFVALPPARRNAICAIYAFMRKADDLSDDESYPREERREMLADWVGRWHAAARSGSASDPVFIAVLDAARRFDIPFELLDELLLGVTMDLQSELSNQPDTYQTFDELYRYCYLVASVVGLVCIRIFGYTDRRAEKLAEETGIAFQLTNILRDVAEDAERKRIYLPLEDLARYGVTIDQLVAHSKAAPTAPERELLKSIADRAEGYYQSAEKLLPLIAAESRPALWVLVSIYHGLLKRIEHADYDVFSERASVPKIQKLSILGVGLARMGMMRMFGRVSS